MPLTSRGLSSAFHPSCYLNLRLHLLGTPILAVLGWTVSAAALTKQECADAHFAAQQARARGKLLAAEEHLATCADATCPGVLRTECGGWSMDLATEIPSIIVAVQSTRGLDVLTHVLTVDGQERAVPPSGVLRLDPGRHSLTASAPGYIEETKTIQLRVGEQNRRVELSLQPVAPPPKIEPGRETWPLWLFGGLTVAGGATFAILGVEARGSERELETCEPNCDDAAIASVRNKYIAANVSLAVGAAALVGGGIWWFSGGPRKKQEVHSRPVAWGLSVDPGAVSLRGRF